MTRIGIIGGSGFDDPDILKSREEVNIQTPYGEPSSPLKLGELSGQEVALLSRHGKEHTIPPSQVNNRANIYALQKAGCSHIIATAACGSLREEISRGRLAVPDQFIDFTRHRATTYHESFLPGIQNAIHTPMADPFSNHIRKCLLRSGEELDLNIHDGGVILTIEGPRFSTRAESHMFRAWGADLINMTVAPEAILANELSIPYAVVAMVTDFDSWKDDEPPLVVDELIKVFLHNVESLINLIIEALPKINNGGPV